MAGRPDDAATGDAFLQLGRDLPPITGLVGECSELAYWKKNGMSSTGYNQGGAPAIYEAFYVANRMLAGGKPVSNLLLTRFRRSTTTTSMSGGRQT